MSRRCFALLLVGTLSSALQAAPRGLPLAGRIIVIDPGHAVRTAAGEILNPGARAHYRGARERDVNLSVSEKLRVLLEAQGARVYMTRTLDNPWRYGLRKNWDNRSRAIFANTMQAEAYVRIHCDWNRTRAFKGFTIYYFRWGSRPLAQAMHRAFQAALENHHDNGIHRRTFVSISSTMPSVLLELGVLSNKQEGKDLALDTYQSRLAQAISSGLVDYFQKMDGHKQQILLQRQRLRILAE